MLSYSGLLDLFLQGITALILVVGAVMLALGLVLGWAVFG